MYMGHSLKNLRECLNHSEGKGLHGFAVKKRENNKVLHVEFQSMGTHEVSDADHFLHRMLKLSRDCWTDPWTYS